VVSLHPGCAVDHAGLGNVFFSGAEPFQISILFQQNASQLKPCNSTLSRNNRQGLIMSFLPVGDYLSLKNGGWSKKGIDSRI